MNDFNSINNLTSESIEINKYLIERNHDSSILTLNVLHDRELGADNFGLDRYPKVFLILLLFSYIFNRLRSSGLLFTVSFGLIITLLLFLIPKLFNDYFITPIVLNFQPMRLLNQ